MRRLARSAWGAAVHLADQAADRLDAWVSDTTADDDVEAEPIGFRLPDTTDDTERNTSP